MAAAEESPDALAQAEGPLPEGAEGAAGQQLDGLSPDGNRRSSISAAIDSVKSWIASKPSSNRNVFIQLVGQMGVGKSSMLEALVKAEDEPQLAKFNEQKQNLMSHHQIQIGERLLKLLDCSGNLRAQHLVREWYTRSIWVFVVYDMANAKSLEAALELAKDVSQTGAKLFMLGNKYNVEQGAPMEADVMRAKDFAVRNEGMSTETSRLIDAIKMVLSANEDVGLERTTSQEIVQAPKTPPVVGGVSERQIRRLETAVVKGHLFSLLPALEGKWSGHAQALSGQEAATSTKIAYKEAEGIWEVRTTTGDQSGMADVHTLQLEPSAHGRCTVTSDDLPAGIYEEQCGDLFATLTHRCLLTGALERMEVWALQTAKTSELKLVRTVSVYKDGDLASTMAASERKVS